MILTHPLWHDLQEYLGPEAFRLDWCNDFDTKVIAERRKYASDQAFYQQTQVYLYHLIATWLSGTPLPMLQFLFKHTHARFPLRILDYGCGIGTVGFWLLQAGYDVGFADVSSPAQDFLEWRLDKHGYMQAGYVFALDRHDDVAAIPRHDVIWCHDVLEHIPSEEQLDFLLQLEHLGHLVIVNLLSDHLAPNGVHYPVDITGLTQAIESRRLVAWKDTVRCTGTRSRERLLAIGRLP